MSVGTRIGDLTSCRVLYTTFGGKRDNLDYFSKISCIVVYNHVNPVIETVIRILIFYETSNSCVVDRIWDEGSEIGR